MGGLEDNQNDNLYVHHNRFLDNGGINFAGGIGIFNGADNYEFANNDVCGNFSAEYGGGLSHFGFSFGAYIHDNNIYYNDAFDEGGGIMISGDPGINPPLGSGSGNVRIESNLIQANLSNDDGGGIRLLNPNEFLVDIINNMIVNNIAADFGGAMAIDDAGDVGIINNTIASNISTQTAEDAMLGQAAVAGLAVELNSAPFQATLPPGAPPYSDPVMFNNIFFDNLAFRWDDPPPTDPDEEPGLRLIPTAFIDIDVVGGGPGDCLDPTYSFLSVDYGPDGADCTATDASNIVGGPTELPDGGWTNDPLFVLQLPAHRLEVLATPNRLDMTQISLFFDRPEGTLVGYTDYHILAGSPVIDAGIDIVGAVPAPTDDIDDDQRPIGDGWEMGADETDGTLPVNQFYFSTLRNRCPPGVLGNAPPGSGCDDADIYGFNGFVFEQVFDARDAGLPGNADIDGLWVLIEPGTEQFYMSFANNTGTTVPGVGAVQDEDVVGYNAILDTWSLLFDGSAVGLGDTNGEDVDAFELLDDGSVVVSTVGTAQVNTDSDDPGSPQITALDEDLLSFTPDATGDYSSGTWAIYFDGSDYGLNDGNAEDIVGVHIREEVPDTPDGVYGVEFMSLTTNQDFATNTGLTGQGNDIFNCQTPEAEGIPFTPPIVCDGFGTYFDGAAAGLTDLGFPGTPDIRIDAIDLIFNAGEFLPQ